MAGDQTNPEKDGMDKDPMKILFGEEIGGLCDDGFEGSNDEQRIFMEILYGNDTVNVSKRCVVTSAVKFEMEDSNRSNALSDSNWKDLTGVSLLGMKDSSGEDVRHANEHFGCSSLKHRKLSDEIPNNENNEFQSKASKEVACSGHAPDFVCTGETIRCHLVESCSHGIISSCLLLKPHKETDVIDDAYNWKGRGSSSQGDGEIVIERESSSAERELECGEGRGSSSQGDGEIVIERWERARVLEIFKERERGREIAEHERERKRALERGGK